MARKAEYKTKPNIIYKAKAYAAKAYCKEETPQEKAKRLEAEGLHTSDSAFSIYREIKIVQLSASLDVVGIVLTLLIIVIGYVISSHQQYKLLKRIDRKLALLLKDSSNKKGDADDATNT